MDICRNYVELYNLIKDIKVAMLTTQDSMDCMRSVPMLTMKTECEGNIWFFSDIDSKKMEELRKNRCVSLSYTDVTKNIFVSISGKAEIVTSRSKMEEMWKPYLNEWFPGGPEFDDLALLKIHMEYAEAWDVEEKKMMRIWDVSHAVII
ncbi:MAG: pyridoxamine 5'-phosphate oxidase family protein [Cytophagaceae bacterium]